uniref:DUF1980 domain-containing protein n=1 Tax=Magnetococcus massalia (strain MO-1) TaxID=451514 RepID=A0A1S7LR39_MAGMO|nr:TIGR03943 family protein [Candidatus Magnetococcus massalia]CRH08256.1 conserved membrane protein of unknown function [Candidatus Magnetococcus massalia]CRH08323.1 conserved membrane protein of unknown function [Candidatus Magnetococcus massalia]
MMRHLFERWGSPLQMAGWLLFMGWIYWGDYAHSYLADLQIDLLIAGWGVLLLIFITQLWQALFKHDDTCGCSDHDHSHTQHDPPLQQSVLILVHFIPWALFVIAGVNTLTIQNQRSLTVSSMRIQQDLVEPAIDVEMVKAGKRVNVTLIDLYSQDILKQNAKVTLIGRVMPLAPDQVTAHMPGHTGSATLLYRMAIACCAADATPLGALLLGQEEALAKLPKDHWVEITATTAGERGKNKLIALEVEKMQSTEQPKKPYLFWLGSLS